MKPRKKIHLSSKQLEYCQHARRTGYTILVSCYAYVCVRSILHTSLLLRGRCKPRLSRRTTIFSGVHRRLRAFLSRIALRQVNPNRPLRPHSYSSPWEVLKLQNTIPVFLFTSFDENTRKMGRKESRYHSRQDDLQHLFVSFSPG